MTGNSTSIAPPWAADPWTMEGTEGTREYRVIGHNKAGRIGVRQLPSGQVRIRIEPSNMAAAERLSKTFTVSDGWKQPDCLYEREFRFSTVTGGEPGVETVLKAIKVLVRDSGPIVRHSKARRWRGCFNNTHPQTAPLSARKAKQLLAAVASR